MGEPSSGGHVFLCYAREDSVRVDELDRLLRAAGLRVWRDTTELWPGQDWRVRIRGAITDGALVFLACFSSRSALRRTGYQNVELVLAAEQARLRRWGDEWLIPVRFDECAVPDLDLGGGRRLGDVQCADLFGGQAGAAAGQLVAAVARILSDGQARAAAGGGFAEGSAYVQQVRRISPPDPPGLVGREAELAELAAFCNQAAGVPYVWWRGGAWAGKSALLSTFVLRPPPEIGARVTIVSFFVTARLAAQDTREAFTLALLDQLAAVTGQHVPAVLPEETRDAFLLDLLARAARQCRDAGGRLVLVVDGLDEDRGVTTEPDAHSIAGLLPPDPPAGMRVIVSGRPDPPVPDDVPDWHPLRDLAIVRVLEPSPHARDVARLARQELARLLHGSPVERDLLGLLTAARGGLSAADLADLADVPLWEVEDVLRRAQGRTFASRPSQHRPGAAPEVYLLGHEELQATAGRYLAGRLAGYHSQLSAWAASWHAKGWPHETPEYLLAGYHQLLDDLGDLPGMTVLAGDAARHDRMLDLTGGDAAALAEIRAALSAIAAQDEPDLASALHLARRRDQLAGRNANIPATLPAVWATLGNITRALALATSIPSPPRQAEALAQVAGALAAAGLYPQAQEVALSIPSPSVQAEALAQVAGALAAAGLYPQAQEIACSISNPYERAGALAQVAVALAATGQYSQGQAAASQAKAAARSITDSSVQARATVQVAGALAVAGQFRQAQEVALSITNPSVRAPALARVAGALAVAGQFRQAREVARSISIPSVQAEALAQVVGALAVAGQHQLAREAASQAEAVARSITIPYGQAQALAQVAGALAVAGQHLRAQEAARSITDPSMRARVLARVAGALAAAGQHQHAREAADQAEAAARSIADPRKRTEVLARVAGALAAAGRHQQAREAADQAEAAARSIATTSSIRAGDLAQVAGALAAAGQNQRAQEVARAITDPYERARAIARVAGALAVAGQHTLALEAASEAEAAAHSITDEYWRRQNEAMARVAGALAAAGQSQRAQEVARSITDPAVKASALARVAGALAVAGQHTLALEAASEAEAAARSITNHPYERNEALARVAGALAAAGQSQRAQEVARTIANLSMRAGALAQMGGALAAAGQHQQACEAADQAEAAARSITNSSERARSLAQIAMALAVTGRTTRSRKITAAVCLAAQWTTAAVPALTLDPSAWAWFGRTHDIRPGERDP